MDSKLFLKNAADKCGAERVRYIEKNIPTSMSNMCVLPFFGDYRSAFILSSLLLKRYREECKGSKYFILCSWPGFEGLFPYVDEYWSIKPNVAKTIFSTAVGMKSSSEDVVSIIRNLNHFFEDVIDINEFSDFYEDGITQGFFDRFKNVKRYLPTLPSSVVLGNEFNRELNKKSGQKVLIYPSSVIYGWRYGKTKSVKIGKEFWTELGDAFIEKGWVPVVCQNHMSHDISGNLLDKAIYFTDPNMLHLAVAMRNVGCVVDVFSGLSRFAILARCPFVCCDERNRFIQTKEYEIDDLCGIGVPREYIYSFCTIIESGNKMMWKSSLIDSILEKSTEVIADTNRDELPSTGESNLVIPYSRVREIKSKRFGTRFIKVKRI